MLDVIGVAKRTLLVLFRWVTLVAMLVAALIAAFDNYAFKRAWQAQFDLFHEARPDYWNDFLLETVGTVAPWLIMALLQGLTIRKQYVSMDIARALALFTASETIQLWGREAQFWWDAARRPEGLPLGDFDGGLDFIFSIPLCLLTVLMFAGSKWIWHSKSGRP